MIQHGPDLFRDHEDGRHQGGSNSSVMMQITEDTPPDMLAGAMDLAIHLPSGATIKMAVERSTPMMDLLVQITTGHRLQHSGHTLQALDMSSPPGHERILPYKPNTPIGALQTQAVRVVRKNRPLKGPCSEAQPFESTFRLKVHLPRNQLYVVRVREHVYLEEIMRKVCLEKDLDPAKYELRHPGNLDEVLDPKLTLRDYKITEVCVVNRGSLGLAQAFTSSDIMALRKEEERKQLHARTGGGVFSLIFKRKKASNNQSNISDICSDSRSISSGHSDDSSSITPPLSRTSLITGPLQKQKAETPPPDKPRPPPRKRGPAPKPPQLQNNINSNVSVGKGNVEHSADIYMKKSEEPASLTICHSRNSSDSSGYHEPSVLSDHCTASLPRRVKSIGSAAYEDADLADHTRSEGNLAKMSLHSKSSTSLTGRKKRAPPPPPPPSYRSLELRPETPKPVVEEPSPIISRTDDVSQPPSDFLPPPTIEQDSDLSVSPPVPEPTKDLPSITTDSNLANSISEAGTEIISSTTKEEEEEIIDTDWQYQLPSPPSAFRDSSPAAPTSCDTTNSIPDIKSESIVSNPELFEKLEMVRDKLSLQQGNGSRGCEEEAPALSNVTLASLEKRKHLVYNRELSTSLKFAQVSSSDVVDTAKVNGKPSEPEKPKRASLMRQERPRSETLPNFKIAAYDSKQNVNIFEDDSVRSNIKKPEPAKRKTYFGCSMENVAFGQNGENVFKKPSQNYARYKSKQSGFGSEGLDGSDSLGRSESFSLNGNCVRQPWKPQNLVQRSKSQSTINLHKEKSNRRADEEGTLSKTNSLFDVSGLQSLEVMRMIQTKLKTPTSSNDNLLEDEKIQSQPLPAQPPSLVPIVHTYQGPASINFSTWSERPKAQVSLMEDNDYKFKRDTTTTSKTPNKPLKADEKKEAESVVIKPHNTTLTAPRIFTAVGYRRPFSGVSKIDKAPRPHSIALDGGFESNRLPVVRSVELKKPFADMPVNVPARQTPKIDKYADTYSSEAIKEIDRLKPCTCSSNGKQNVIRASSFTDRHLPGTPPALPVENVARSRKSWSVPKNSPISIVPFSRSNLKPVRPNNVRSFNAFVAPPPPPPIKLSQSQAVSRPPNADPRDELLSSIRNFGGKKGLKSLKTTI